MKSSLKRRVPWLLAAVLAPLAAGCLPNATWLPDSSGFVYTGGPKKDQLLLYDVAKGKPRVLAEKNAGPAWPAVSPDGKRVAVVLRKDDGTDVYLEVAVFDRDGKELQRSKRINWKLHMDDDYNKTTAPQAFWAPTGERLLIASDDLAAFYDLKEQGATKLDFMVATFGATPIRPDGKGFLAYKKGNDSGAFEYILVGWDGKEKKIAEKTKDLFAGKGDPDDDERQGMLAFPLMHSSHWDGSTAVVSWGERRIRIDAEKLTATLETIKPELSADKKVVQDESRLAGGVTVRVVELKARYSKDPKGLDDPAFGRYRIEVQKADEKEPKVLMPEADYFLICPSPDGKTAVVRGAKSIEAMFEPKPGDDLLFLIDAKGEVAAKIDTAK